MIFVGVMHLGVRMTEAIIETRLDANRNTGFPMVDACIRSLCETGWLNFRMRAMIVSLPPIHCGWTGA